MTAPPADRRHQAYAAVVAVAALVAAMLLSSRIGEHTVRPAGTTGLPYGVYATTGTQARELPLGGTPNTPFVNPSDADDVDVGAVAINSNSTRAVVTVVTIDANAFIPPAAEIFDVSGNGTTRVGGISGIDPIGYAMSPTNPNLGYALTSGGDGGGGTIYQMNLSGGGAATVFTALPVFDDEQVEPTSIAMTPNGQTLIVGWTGGNDSGLFAISTSTALGTGVWFVPTGDTLTDVAVAQSGTEAVAILSNGDGTGIAGVALPLPASTSATLFQRTLKTPLGGRALAFSPDGSTVYVAGPNGEGNGSSSALVAVSPASGVPGATATIPISTIRNTGGAAAVAVSPDGSTVLVSGSNSVAGAIGQTELVSVNAATFGVGAPTNLGGGRTIGPQAIAITPDQAPVANLSPASGKVGSPVTLNAGSSSVTYGSITGYAWNFGDGTTGTGGPTTTHTYAAAGNYTVTVTETDQAHNSVPNAFGTGGRYPVNSDGQTPYLISSPLASISAPVAIGANSVPPPPTTTTTVPGQHTTNTTTTTTTSTTVPKKSAGKPTLTLNPAVGPPGSLVFVTGTGFAKNTNYIISWSTNTGSISVKSDGNGNIATATMIILTPDILGPRQAQAETTPSAAPVAQAPFLVVPSTSEPGGDDGSFLFRSEGP